MKIRALWIRKAADFKYPAIEPQKRLRTCSLARLDLRLWFSCCATSNSFCSFSIPSSFEETSKKAMRREVSKSLLSLSFYFRSTSSLFFSFLEICGLALQSPLEVILTLFKVWFSSNRSSSYDFFNPKSLSNSDILFLRANSCWAVVSRFFSFSA